jgi:lysophospholipase L1-like esterase
MSTLTPLDLHSCDAPVRFAGVQEVRPGADGVVLNRLSPTALRHVVEPGVQMLSTFMPGARVEFLSDTTTVEIELQVTRLELPRELPTITSVDLVVDGGLVANAAVTGGTVLRIRTLDPPDLEVEEGGPSSVRFDGLPSRAKRIEVWLPHNASVKVRELRIDRDAHVAQPEETRRRWVHYGSSISQCVEAPRPTSVWSALVARRVGVDLLNLAFAGEAQLDQFVARDIRDLHVDLVSLKVGINVVTADSMRERAFVPAVHAFLDTIRDGHPTVPIVVATPIICPAVEERPGPTHVDHLNQVYAVERTPDDSPGALSLARIRKLLEGIVTARREDGDDHVFLVSGLDLFGADDVADLPDGIHPNPEGQVRIADRFERLTFGAGRPFAERT